MAPTVILIRHAEALHNIDARYDIPDPVLSSTGEQQCVDLQASLRDLPLANEVQLIVTSPMRRTLQTAQLALAWLVERGVKVLPLAELQENSDKPCDTGSDLAEIAREFPDIDFSAVHSLYPAKTGVFEFSQAAVTERAHQMRIWLKARPEKAIIVVSHAAFMRSSLSHTYYLNADYRVFDFAVDGDMDELVEWESTANNGGGMGKSWKGRAGILPHDFPNDVVEGSLG